MLTINGTVILLHTIRDAIALRPWQESGLNISKILYANKGEANICKIVLVYFWSYPLSHIYKRA